MQLTTYKNIMCLLLFTVVTNTISAQDFNNTLEKVNEYYKTVKTYNITATYSMYRGYSGNTVTESYDSKMYKTDGVIAVTALGAEVLTFSNAKITVNDSKKTIVYVKSNNENFRNNLIDVEKLSQFYNQTAFKEEGNTIIYEISLKEKAGNVPYNKIIFHVNKHDFSLAKQAFFFSSKLPFTSKEGVREHDLGRMEITYAVSNEEPKNNKVEDYVVSNNNDDISLSKAYNDYKLINQTPYN